MTDNNKHRDIPRDYSFSRDDPLPEGLVSVRFREFNEPIPAGALPSSLKEIDFGHYFNQEVFDGNIPENVEILIFGSCFSKSMDGLTVRHLKSIRCHKKYHEVVPGALLPVMDDYYKSNYELYKKMKHEYVMSCRGLDESLFPVLPAPVPKHEFNGVDVRLSVSLLADSKTIFNIPDICGRIEKHVSERRNRDLYTIWLELEGPNRLRATVYDHARDGERRTEIYEIIYSAVIQTKWKLCYDGGDEYEQVTRDHELAHLRLVDDDDDSDSERAEPMRVAVYLSMLLDTGFIHMPDIRTICKVFRDTVPAFCEIGFDVNEENTLLTAIVSYSLDDGTGITDSYVGRYGTYYRVYRREETYECSWSPPTIDDKRVGPLTIEEISEDVQTRMAATL